jgi:nitric oxide reductase activation protein
LLQGLTRQDWQAAAQCLQAQLTSAVIDEATATLPDKVQLLSGQEINRKLKARLQ